MAERNPIKPNSITSADLPPHLRKPFEINLGQKEKLQINNLYSNELGYQDALIGENYLMSHIERSFYQSEGKFRIATPYYMTNVDLDNTIWHIIRFDTVDLKGDRAFEYNVNHQSYFQANISGRYRISANIRIYYVNAQGGSPTKYEGVVIYVAQHVTNFPDEVYLLAIYNTDGTQKEIISMFPFYTHHLNGITNVFSNNFNLPFSGSTILWLEAGEKIDIRINLLGYTLAGEVRFRFEGTASINFINEREDLI